MKNEKTFENFTQKNGKKQKAEKLIKKAFKKLQKTTKKKSLNMIKKVIVFSAEGVSLIKQTIKKGKRKKISTKTLILTSEKSRLSKSYLNIVSNARLKNNSEKYYQKLSTLINKLNKNSEKDLLPKNAVIDSIEKKSTIKFRW